MQTTGLVKVTIAAPRRRLDMALPEQAAISEILPGLLARAGEGLADDGVPGGWLLRRADGTVCELDRTLAAHRIRDGEILQLTPSQTEWPELEYDDLVDAIATGSQGTGRAWGPRHTRHAALTIGAAALLTGLVAVVRAGSPWTPPALWALGVAAILLAAAVVLARAVGDAGVGAVLAATALPYAFAGGGLVLAGATPMTGLSAGHLLLAGAALLLAALVGYLGVAAAAPVFAGAAVLGLLTVAGAWLAGTETLTTAEAAAVLAAIVLALSTAYAPLSLRLGRVPMPMLPRSAADLIRDDPQPSLELVHAAVVRADALLTGMLAGSSAVLVACQIILVRSGSTAGVVLAALVGVGLLLRARLYPILHQRIPMLIAAVLGLGCLVAGPLMGDRTTLLAVAGPVVLALGATVIATGVARKHSPYLSRFAEYADMLVMAAIVPVTCAVLGLYAYVRGLGG
ncbi:type VII secretion integral membrane protein EccD [Hamadaea flava]|uniref:Type VII secretion integral membrane protein EccD n=1 Tax=Hamadaea flava TaxID=1742688 RepID=A0ABV8LPM2_9ACTN|nr:type VII secretion integral membrane protein EccD [Hamadaea flava]MCP2323148.1 type VII secretion integral membrane protein EccD [Hamadaea flava]